MRLCDTFFHLFKMHEGPSLVLLPIKSSRRKKGTPFIKLVWGIIDLFRYFLLSILKLSFCDSD